MKLIETKTLGSAAASIEFTSIPQDGTDLLVLVAANSTTDTDTLALATNGITTGFSERNLLGTGLSAVSQSNSLSGVQITGVRTATANTFSNAAVYIPNYTSATNKSFSVDGTSEANASSAYQFLVAGLSTNTSAITSVRVYVRQGNNLIAGSTVSLYKITKGTDGIVVVS